MPNEKNLIPNTERTPEEIRENCSKAGKQSGENRRKRKMMSQIYGEILAKKHKVGGEDIKGEKLLEKVVLKVLARGDSASVALMKEIREATEGNNLNLSGGVIIYLDNQDKDL